MDTLIFLAGILALPAVVLLGSWDDRRYRATLAAPRPVAEPRAVPDPGRLPYWAATPGPAQWSAIARRPRRLPEVLRFEDPPRPDGHLVPPNTLTASVAEAWDRWEAHLAALMLPEVA
jgi:hypothetical protein